MASIKVKLNTQRITQRGYPIVIQIIHHRRKKLIYTSHYLKEQEFDKEKEIAVTKSRSLRKQNETIERNNHLQEERKKIEIIIAHLERMNQPYDVDHILYAHKMYNNNLYLETFAESLISEMILRENEGSAMAYRAVIKKIKLFLGDQHLFFDDIDNKTVLDFKAFLKREGRKTNTVNFYLRIFRAIYNKAVNEGHVTSGRNPFRNIKLGSETTPKRAINKESLKQIAEIDLSNDRYLEEARDLFLFSFYTRGMPFVDCAFLKHSNIKESTIEYFRHKTNQKLSIELSPQMKAILSKYSHSTDYVLPILDSSISRPLYEQYRNALRKHNIRLKTIGERLGIKLSSYVTRHSWATIAKNEGIPLSVISEGLGRLRKYYLRLPQLIRPIGS